MIKNLEPKLYGAPAERAAHTLIYYFKLAIGEEAFRRSGGDMEIEITEIVQNTVNQAVAESHREIVSDQINTLRDHIAQARQAIIDMDYDKTIPIEVEPLRHAVSHLADAMNRIVERLG